MIHLILFGPSAWNQALLALSQAQQFVHPLDVELDDTDATLYRCLLDHVIQLVPTETSPSAIEASSAKGSTPERFDQILILTPQMGDRFSTIALSIPRHAIYVVAGVNVEMLSSLRTLSPTLKDHITLLQDSGGEAQAETQGEDKLNPSQRGELTRLDWAVVSLCESLSTKGRDGVTFLNGMLRDVDDESTLDLSMMETDFGSL